MSSILKTKKEREKFKRVIEYAVKNPEDFEEMLSKNLYSITFEDKNFLNNLLNVLVNPEFAENAYKTLKEFSQLRTESNKPLIYVKINEFLDEYSLDDAVKMSADLDKLAIFIMLYNQTIHPEDPIRNLIKMIMEEKGVSVDYIEQQRRKGVHENIIRIFKFVIEESQLYDLRILRY